MQGRYVTAVKAAFFVAQEAMKEANFAKYCFDRFPNFTNQRRLETVSIRSVRILLASIQKITDICNELKDSYESFDKLAPIASSFHYQPPIKTPSRGARNAVVRIGQETVDLYAKTVTQLPYQQSSKRKRKRKKKRPKSASPAVNHEYNSLKIGVAHERKRPQSAYPLFRTVREKRESPYKTYATKNLTNYNGSDKSSRDFLDPESRTYQIKNPTQASLAHFFNNYLPDSSGSKIPTTAAVKAKSNYEEFESADKRPLYSSSDRQIDSEFQNLSENRGRTKRPKRSNNSTPKLYCSECDKRITGEGFN